MGATASSSLEMTERFAENQPFTSMIETLRGLLLGTPIGSRAMVAISRCVAIEPVGYLSAPVAYNRDPVR